MVTRRDVFSAVFPSAAKATVPTPSSTPQLSSAPFGEASFTFPNVAFSDGGDHAAKRIKWERAWHSATTFLGLRNEVISPPDDAEDYDAVRGRWIKLCTAEVSAAITYLGLEREDGHPEDNLMDWYTQEVGRHYIQYQLPLLLEILSRDNDPDLLSDLLKVLQVSQAVYFHPLREYVISSLPETGRFDLIKFQEGYHAMVALSLSNSSFATHLSRFLERQGSIILGLELPESSPMENGMEVDQESLVSEARNETLELVRYVDRVGLGGAQAQRIFAEVMSGLLTAHVNTSYAGKWSSPSNVPNELREWVENIFARFVVEVLSCLRRDKETQTVGASPVTLTDLANWKHRAICDLGALRIKELFEIIVDWDNDSKGAVEDLKQYVTTTTARSHLTDSFSAVISHRLLHPGASTTEILQVYVCIIRVFAVLDPKGVLLDRLARPIRRYLRDRDDKAKIIVEGLLSDASDEAENPDALTELAIELSKATENAPVDDDDAELDYDDMNWLPDPVDAGPDYKKSKGHDVIGTLISLFESKDVFVRELQDILSERLLLPRTSLEKETRVLELLKLRFGDAPLQACEVMLKDIIESRRTDTVIHRRGGLSTAAGPQIHATILSRLFWPSLSTEDFSIPPSILSLQTQYATAFEAVKPTRKLTWLQTLGIVTVELQLQDRTVIEDVHPWQASIIFAFQDEDITASSDEPVSRTVPELEETLSMPPTMLQQALQFWVSKLVLRETSAETYTVLETLSPLDLESSTRNPSAFSAVGTSSSATKTGGGKSAEEIMMERMEEFWPYVVGMLTNQGQMKAEKIVLMLKFVVPGGFPFGGEEVREFMRAKVEEGKCEMAGGAYKIKK